MAPELFTTMEADELQKIAKKVRGYQQSRNLSDAALLRKFGGLGSTKTYKRILGGDLAELDLERQLNSYRAVEALIDSLGNANEVEEEIYDDLYPVIELRRVFLETAQVTGLARVVFLQGPNGSGKSSARKFLSDKYGQRLLMIEATEVWNDSPMSMLGAFLIAMGVKEIPYNQTDRLRLVIDLLSQSRRGVLLEEAHHLGPRLLNTIKTLVNNTPGEFFLFAVDTLWRKLERAAYEEARQLSQNRLAERIVLPENLMPSDVEKFLTRRIKWAHGDIAQAVKLVLDKSATYGRFAFVRDVCIRANENANGDPVTMELFVQALATEVKSR